jgi:DNA-binding NtrC family response regulator
MIRILVVEDEQAQLDNLKHILEEGFPKYEIHAVQSFSEAKDIIRKFGTVSLVITDFRLLPDGTGYDLLKYCLENLTNVPVIIITAYGKDEDQEVRAALSFQKGAFDFMDKPIDFDELKERVRHALKIAEDLA